MAYSVQHRPDVDPRPGAAALARADQPGPGRCRGSTTSGCTTRSSPSTARDEMLLRLQTNFLHNQNDINLPELKERLKNQFQLFGDDMFMTGGIGEWGAPVPASTTAASFAAWTEAQRLIAQARWRNENAAGSLGALDDRDRRLRGGRRGVRDQGPALARPARRRRDPRAARTAEGARRRHLHVRPPLDGHGRARRTGRSSTAASRTRCTRTASTSRR